MRKLSVGDQVRCRFFNTPDNRHYGHYFIGVIEAIEDNHFYGATRGYKINSPSLPFALWVKRNEIFKRVG